MIAVTQQQVARKLGLSRQSVRFALSEDASQQKQIRPDTRQRILKAVQQMGYRPNCLARGLRASKTNTIGFVIRTMDHPAHSALNERVTQLLEAEKFEVLVTAVPDFRDTTEAEELYYSHYPEGMIVGPTYAVRPTAFFRDVARRGTPLVCYDGSLDYPLDQVTHDHWKIVK